ncbi:hypothetical protein [Clostridium estertheticum]|uniref:hypothetical protein n=1 Tax=Clostridium estertheticum TaxID=238834 RepID=UPI001CF1669C|nr:hypothetical protein [Clostridium estertheticum]MCB2357843.1 hypothetical protein [Clostridium estertheticum]
MLQYIVREAHSFRCGSISNKIIEGGAIYVKDFLGNWIDNTTGKIVDASVIPGEEITSGTTTDLDK